MPVLSRSNTLTTKIQKMSAQIPLIAGQYYPIYNRGNNKNDIFFETDNYRYFLSLYKKYILPVAKTYAYCLMKNHFHLLVYMREDIENNKQYSLAFSNFFGTYAKAINKNYHRTGSLFEKPFKRILVTSDKYFIHLVSYIHRNPQKHNFVTDFHCYPYSSYKAIYQQRQSYVETQEVLNWFTTIERFENYHNQFDESLIRHLIIEDDF